MPSHVLPKILPQSSDSSTDTKPPSTTASYSYDPFSCYCPHGADQHALARCGHPNDRPPSHPFHTANDALHRVWCSQCAKWCFSGRNDCPVFENPDMEFGFETGKGAVGDDKMHGPKVKKAIARM